MKSNSIFTSEQSIENNIFRSKMELNREYEQVDDESRLQSLSSNELKNTGNKYCAIHKYEEAIKCYTWAIKKNPVEPIYFSNRALCHLKLGNYNEAIQDCHLAIDLDSNLIKGHFFLGQALAELEQYDEALKHLQKAYDIARERKLNFGDDIAYQIRLTKRRRWNKHEEKNEKLEKEMQEYLLNLLKKDKENEINDLKLKVQSSAGSTSNASNHESETRFRENEIETKFELYASKLRSMFEALGLQRQNRDVPEYLCGKISFEIMQDPVITPSGITYDRPDIEEHLKRVGHFDPVTRQPLKPEQMIPNLVMKEVIDAYLNENEWASYY